MGNSTGNSIPDDTAYIMMWYDVIFSGPQDPKEVDPRLITPIIAKIFCCVPDDRKKALWCGVAHDTVSCL